MEKPTSPNEYQAASEINQLDPLLRLPCIEKKFFSELALCLGIAIDGKAKLEANRIFSGPSGLLCRIQTRQNREALNARPEVILPLAMSELDDDDVQRLMSLQAATLNELGWYLGLSNEGLLAVSPLHWTAQANVVASELDVGNLLGGMVMDFMATDPCDDTAPLPFNDT